jgi:hypothetical protein
VSINDLARLSAKARRSGVEHELVETFAAICQPRVAARPHTTAASSPLITV